MSSSGVFRSVRHVVRSPLRRQALVIGAAAVVFWGCGRAGREAVSVREGVTPEAAQSVTDPFAEAVPAAATVAAGSPDAEPTVERGRYIVKVAGCNDCHTPGFMQKGYGIPETEWLTGVPVGWKGPWGTTYASNLRLFLKDFDEETFVQMARARNTRPPMPWPNLHGMNDQDLRSVYRYIRSLPVKGEKMPEYVPPGQEPSTAYVEMVPQMPKTQASVQ